MEEALKEIRTKRIVGLWVLYSGSYRRLKQKYFDLIKAGTPETAKMKRLYAKFNRFEVLDFDNEGLLMDYLRMKSSKELLDLVIELERFVDDFDWKNFSVMVADKRALSRRPHDHRPHIKTFDPSGPTYLARTSRRMSRRTP